MRARMTPSLRRSGSSALRRPSWSPPPGSSMRSRSSDARSSAGTVAIRPDTEALAPKSTRARA